MTEFDRSAPAGDASALGRARLALARQDALRPLRPAEAAVPRQPRYLAAEAANG